MLHVLRKSGPVEPDIEVAAGWTLPADAVWIELVNPTREEELAVETAVGVELPTRDEMAEIEASSRLYQENGATYMIASLICGLDDAHPVLGPVTFVLVGERLVTIRYVHPKAFAAFKAQTERQPEHRANGAQVLLGLLEAVVDRDADFLEHVSAKVEEIAGTIFNQPKGGAFRVILTELAKAQARNNMARESLVSLGRLTSFATLAPQIEQEPEGRTQLRSLQRDVQSLTEHSSYVSGNLTFLLDAALGLINIEQNEVTKIFSIAAVILLPPTLIATWYGMNFRHMPELAWPWAYPAAFVLAVASAVLPYVWIKRKGWL